MDTGLGSAAAPETTTAHTRIKICGLTRTQDIDAAVALGADAVGFVCHPASPRFVPVARLPELASAVPPFVTPVLLFVDASPEVIERSLAAVPHAMLQFHGAETPEQCESAGRPFLRALAIAPGVDLIEFESRFGGAAGILADAPAPGHGGGGRAFDWSLLPARRSLPLILAGGLDAGNVAEAIGRVRPYAVDVSSGVEETRGIKSESRMRDFIAAVRGADAVRTQG